MRLSAYATRDERTAHEVWCDLMVAKAKKPTVRTYSSAKVERPQFNGLRRNDYTNFELIQKFNEQKER